MKRLRTNPNCIPIGIIGLMILAVNLPTLVDLVTRDPMQLFSAIPSGAPHQALPGISIIDPNAGYITQALGHLVAMDWLHGHVPWWNPYEGLGAPLAGGMQSGAFFPPVLLLQNAFGFVVFHVVLEGVAGYATYFLLRRLGLGRAASTAGGVAFALCGTFAWFEHATANPVAFLPLAVLGVERAREASMGSRRYGWRLLAVALALSVVAGFPEVAYLDGLLVLVWAAVRLFSVQERWRAMLAKLALGGLAGVLLSAPALVAFVDYLPHANVGDPRGSGGQCLPADSEFGPDHPAVRVWAYLWIQDRGKRTAADGHVVEHRRLSRCQPRFVRLLGTSGRSPALAADCPWPLGSDRHEQNLRCQLCQPSVEPSSRFSVDCLLQVLPDFLGVRGHRVGRFRNRRSCP